MATRQQQPPKQEQQQQPPQDQRQPSGQERAMHVANQQIAVLKQRLEVKREEIRFLLGDYVRAQKLMMSALMKAADDEKIRKCEPNSIVRSVIQAALCDADLSAGLGEGWLIPYWNKELGVTECTFQPGYRLGQRRVQEATGMRVVADVVCEKDHWRYSQLPLICEHTPAEGERGKRVRSYAAALDNDGRVMFIQIATAKDIEEAMKASRKNAEQDSPAWRNWADRMWRKVAIMRLAKETRSYKTNEKLDRLLAAEEEAMSGARSFMGDLPEPRVLPPGVPEEGRGRIGASSAPRHEPEAAPPVAARAATDEPAHDPATGEVVTPAPVVTTPTASAAPAAANATAKAATGGTPPAGQAGLGF